MIPMRSSVVLALVLAGCLHPAVQECDGGGETWVCPAAQACAQPPTYCATPNEVGACQDKVDNDACSSALVADGICAAGVCTTCGFDVAACRYVGWNPMTSGTTSDLTSIAFTKFGEAYVGTKAGELRHYLTSGWTAVNLGMTDVTSVVAIQASDSRVYALLTDTAAINQRVAYLEGGTWTVLPALGGASDYAAMWVSPTRDVFLAGNLAAVAHFNGTGWTESTVVTTPATQRLNAVWGTSTSDVYAVGNKHNILHFNGTTWSAVASPGGAFDSYGAVSGANGTVFVAGTIPGTMTGTGLVQAVGGGAFAAMPAPAITMAARAIWAATASDVWIAGDSNATSLGAIAHWDGVSWTQIQAPTQSPLRAIAASEADEIFAVGTNGTVLRYTGAAWAVNPPPPASALGDLWAAAPNEVFAVGSTGAFHLQADRTWSSSPGIYQAVTGRSATDVVAVGTGVTSVWNGSAFPGATASPIGASNDIAASATAYYTISDQLFSSPNGSTWTHQAVTPDTLNGVHGMWLAPSGVLWFAAGSGVYRVDTSLASTTSTTGTFNSIWGGADDDIYVVGNEVRHFDGTRWSAMTVPTPAKLNGVWGRTTDDVFAVGVNQTLLHYHRGLWKQLSTPFTAGDLGAISGAGDSVFVTSLDGKVYQLVETVP